MVEPVRSGYLEVCEGSVCGEVSLNEVQFSRRHPLGILSSRRYSRGRKALPRNTSLQIVSIHWYAACYKSRSLVILSFFFERRRKTCCIISLMFNATGGRCFHSFRIACVTLKLIIARLQNFQIVQFKMPVYSAAFHESIMFSNPFSAVNHYCIAVPPQQPWGEQATQCHRPIRLPLLWAKTHWRHLLLRWKDLGRKLSTFL